MLCVPWIGVSDAAVNHEERRRMRMRRKGTNVGDVIQWKRDRRHFALAPVWDKNQKGGPDEREGEKDMWCCCCFRRML